ncbi:hypothetical protein GYMLUDRAFT_966913 [Collybiopsis luxurians FD-317 M1]|uniref:Uncharacterized protein n=1 Tax=Collybiopsis luxurians FD-317 M1 TaxID=944289 RepID=A0A0D0BDF1_9AGAR|nr:hypothetical protein GYMLUDRAFT_966913 [Collybiopsis luxurians FD-317 M1]
MYRQSGTRNYVRAGPTAVWTLMLVAFLQFLLVERATAAPVDIRAGSIARRESEASILGYTLWKWKWKEDLLGHLQVAESDHTTTMTFEMVSRRSHFMDRLSTSFSCPSAGCIAGQFSFRKGLAIVENGLECSGR